MCDQARLTWRHQPRTRAHSAQIAKVVKSKSNDEWLSGDSRALRALTREIHATLQHVVCSVERSALEKGARDVW